MLFLLLFWLTLYVSLAFRPMYNSRMSIEEFKEKIKHYGDNGGKDRLFVVSILILSSTLSFGLGRLSSVPERAPILAGTFEKLPGVGEKSLAIDNKSAQTALTASVSNAVGNTPTKSVPGAVFASKSGTRYYPQGCKAGNRVSEANKIWFKSAAEAEKIGLSKGASC